MLLAIETRTHGVFHASKLVCAPVRADLPGSRASLAAQKGYTTMPHTARSIPVANTVLSATVPKPAYAAA